jgi:hypothetical protein
MLELSAVAASPEFQIPWVRILYVFLCLCYKHACFWSCLMCVCVCMYVCMLYIYVCTYIHIYICIQGYVYAGFDTLSIYVSWGFAELFELSYHPDTQISSQHCNASLQASICAYWLGEHQYAHTDLQSFLSSLIILIPMYHPNTASLQASICASFWFEELFWAFVSSWYPRIILLRHAPLGISMRILFWKAFCSFVSSWYPCIILICATRTLQTYSKNAVLFFFFHNHRYIHPYIMHTYIHTLHHTCIRHARIHTYFTSCMTCYFAFVYHTHPYIHSSIHYAYIHAYIHAYFTSYMHTYCFAFPSFSFLHPYIHISSIHTYLLYILHAYYTSYMHAYMLLCFFNHAHHSRVFL